MNLKRFLSCRKSRINSFKTHFFDDVCIEDEKLKDDIMNWISRLKINENISINKFSDLFSKFDVISFPIKVSGHHHRLEIKDNLGKDYYLFYYFPYGYREKINFTIGRRAYPYDKEFVYRLTPQNEVILQELAILQLNEDNTNTDNRLNFHYDYKSLVTNAILETKTLTIEITYPLQNYIKDNNISTYLFCLANQFTHIDDVSSILEFISNILNLLDKKYSLTIKSYMNSNSNKEFLSKLCISNGIVTKHSFTTRPTSTQICLNQFTLSEEVEKFILSHKN